MASAVEMEKLQKTQDYFRRYFEYEDAVAVNHENRDYLKTYIHTNTKVELDFGLKKKNLIALGIAAGAGLLCGLIAMLIAGTSDFGVKNFIALGVTFVVVLVAVLVVLRNLIRKKFEQVWDSQKEINEGIREQIDELTRRCDTLEKQKVEYLKALEEKQLVCIPTKHIKYADEIASYVKEDKVETVEEAVAMFEENVKLKRISKEKERKRKQSTASPAERFGNPLQGLSMGMSSKSSTRRNSVRDTRKPLAMPQSRANISDKENEAEIGAALTKVLGASMQTSSAPAASSSGGLSMMPSGKKEKKPSFVQTIVREPVEEIKLVEEPVEEAVVQPAAEPVAEVVAPVVEEAAPIVEGVAVEEAAPIVEEVAVEEVAPIVEEVAVEEAAPIVEEVATEAPRFSFAMSNKKPAAKKPAFVNEVAQPVAAVAEEAAPIVEEVAQPMATVAEQTQPEVKSFGLSLASGSKQGASYSGNIPEVVPKSQEAKKESGFPGGGLRMAQR